MKPDKPGTQSELLGRERKSSKFATLLFLHGISSDKADTMESALWVILVTAANRQRRPDEPEMGVPEHEDADAGRGEVARNGTGCSGGEQMNRRELLRYFGIGATITPILNGMPRVEAVATLLAVPEVNPIVVDKFPDGHIPNHYMDRLLWNPYEAIWLRHWQIDNNPPPYLNSGIGALESVLKREPTADEKAAVAGIMQWFGNQLRPLFYRRDTSGLRVSCHIRRESSERSGHKEIAIRKRLEE